MGIPIEILYTPLLALLLPFFRILALIHFAPVLDNSAFSRKTKMALALMLAIIITPMLPTQIVPTEVMSLRTTILVGEQLLWGALFGLALRMVFVVLQSTGQILAMNMGLSMATMNDPVNGVSSTVVSELITVFATLLFFIMDGHLLVVSVLYKGFTYWPIGQAINDPTLKLVANCFGWIIASATLLSLPTTFVMLIVQGGFGLLNRISPSLNLYSLGFPISMLFGLLCLSMMMSNIPEHYLHLVNTVLAQLDKVRSA
ncbi:flagellar biosynthetic protein FliR [Enterobacter ludwigii]|uniref:flagellar biosynthetic protein FliR n=1 Tax=Enterobacter ludwigii TaxID=299767 RepID=UPI003F6E6946